MTIDQIANMTIDQLCGDPVADTQAAEYDLLNTAENKAKIIGGQSITLTSGSVTGTAAAAASSGGNGRLGIGL